MREKGTCFVTIEVSISLTMIFKKIIRIMILHTNTAGDFQLANFSRLFVLQRLSKRHFLHTKKNAQDLLRQQIFFNASARKKIQDSHHCSTYY